MKNFLLIPVILFFFLFIKANTQAQDQEIQAQTLDQQIDQAFTPFSNAVQSVIFYSFKVKESVDYGTPDGMRGEKAFYKHPPFILSYPKTIPDPKNAGQMMKNPAPFGSTYLIHSLGDDRFTIQGPVETDTLTLGQEGNLNGFVFTVKDNPESKAAFKQGVTYTVSVNTIGIPIVLIILILGASYFTIYFNFVNITKFKLAIDVVRGKYTDPTEKGEVSHFQALTAALSGTVGLGNIAGVAIAISIGGAGATFWMVLAGLLGMSSKFTECTLGVKYRHVNEKGVVSGGPFYYLSQGLKEKGMGGLGKVFAIFFAIMCIGGSFGGGNMFQVNQAYQQFVGMGFSPDSYIANNGWLFGAIMAVLVAVVIIGGIKSIAKVTDKIVPFMCGIYVLAALVILGVNFKEIPHTFVQIFEGAFAPTAVMGGFVGVLIQGFRRAAFSNEAGVGSASIAHSAVKTNNPASEGIVALLEPFIDTVVVCTMTALVIVITGNHMDQNASDGVALTSRAFESVLPWFKYVLGVAVILFAFSTMITWSYYGLKAWTYLVGDNPVTDIIYKVVFCLMVVVGSAASLGSVVGFSDAMIFAMVFPNIIGLVILAPVVREELKKYLGKIASGEIIRH